MCMHVRTIKQSADIITVIIRARWCALSIVLAVRASVILMFSGSGFQHAIVSNVTNLSNKLCSELVYVYFAYYKCQK